MKIPKFNKPDVFGKKQDKLTASPEDDVFADESDMDFFDDFEDDFDESLDVVDKSAPKRQSLSQEDIARSAAAAAASLDGGQGGRQRRGSVENKLPEAQPRQGGFRSREDRTGNAEAQPRQGGFRSREDRAGNAEAQPRQGGFRSREDRTGNAEAQPRQGGFHSREDRAGNAEAQPRQSGNMHERPRTQSQTDSIRIGVSDNETEATYIPPESVIKDGLRQRYKKRNRRPMRMWLKATITITAIVLCFAVLIVTFYSNMMMSRVCYVGDSTRNMVRLYKQEQYDLAAESSDFVEDTEVFTKPGIVAQKNENVRVILLVSSDINLTDEHTSQCDALMLAAIDSENHSIKLVSIMRDLYVRIPGHLSNKIVRAYYYDAANGDYTLPTLRQTIEDNLGIAIDNYVVVDFDAIQIIVDRLGGVDMELTEEEALYMSTDPKYGFFPRFINGGTYTMSGAETLNYMRIVKLGFGDYDRVLRQRMVLYQLVQKFRDLSFMELSELSYAVLPMLPTDMTERDVWNMMWDAREFSTYEISQLTFPIVGSWRSGNAVVNGKQLDLIVTNFEFNADVLSDFIYKDDRTYVGSYAEDVAIPEIAPAVSGSDVIA